MKIAHMKNVMTVALLAGVAVTCNSSLVRAEAEFTP